MDLAIIDYKMSNLHSVREACKKVNIDCEITSKPEKILDAKIAILPGVGAFGEAMLKLQERDLDDCIIRFFESGRPIIGICLGLQLLFESSDEFGSYKGLGLVKGSVKKFDLQTINDVKYPIPQIGWNKIFKNEKDWKDSLLKNNIDGDFMYFVHSHYAEPKDKNIIYSTTLYGQKNFCSSIKFQNIFAVQYHPEKSGENGLKIYKQIRKVYL